MSIKLTFMDENQRQMSQKLQETNPYLNTHQKDEIQEELVKQEKVKIAAMQSKRLKDYKAKKQEKLVRKEEEARKKIEYTQKLSEKIEKTVT